MDHPRILVTGGTGLLGTHLILHLHSLGLRPRALYRSHIPDVVKDKAEWVKGDVLDVTELEDALHGIHQVYHVAGYVSFNPKHKASMHKINIEGTANVVNACLDAKVDKLVHVSSVAALGRIRVDGPINENMNWTEETSNSEYGRTKFLAEMEVWRGISEGLNAAMVNPVIIIGEHGDWTKGSMNIFRNIYHGFKWFTTGSTGFVDADDVAKTMVLLMDSNITAERFVISAENLAYKSLFDIIADAFGVKRPYTQVTPFIAALVWRIEKIKSLLTGNDPLITKETARTGMTSATFDNTKFLKAFPSFSYNPLQESVQRICHALKQQHS
jgi:nucleoside-diphosphate-sugar epimerase